MRILFVLKGLSLVRHFDEVVTHLADAGHQIILAPTKFGDEDLLPDALAAHANCSVVAVTIHVAGNDLVEQAASTAREVVTGPGGCRVARVVEPEHLCLTRGPGHPIQVAVTGIARRA